MRWLILALFLLPASAASAADWPNVRGPQWDGHSPIAGLADTWPEAGPPVLWARKLGQGYSGFAVVGGRAVTMHQTALGQFVLCLDAETGQTLWEHRCGLPYEPLGIYPGPRATPTVWDGRVYFITPQSRAGCLDLQSGRVIWDLNLSDRFAGEGTGFGYSASLLVLDGRVILPIGGANAGLVALNAEDGSTVWTSGDHSASYCPTIPISLDGRTLLVSYLENHLTINDPISGRLLAEHEISHGYDEHAALPLWDEPRLIYAAPFKAGATCLSLAWRDEGTQDEAVELTHQWHSREMSNDVCSSVLVDGCLYGFDLRDPQSKAHRPSRGWLRCLDVATGETLWTTNTVGQASIVAADGKLVLFVDTGEVILARASPESYVELARTQLFADEICWTAPALADGRLYLRTQSRAACVYLGGEAGQPRAMDSATGLEVLRARHQRWADWLLGGEREHPFMPAPLEDLQRWYAACLLGGLAATIAVSAAGWRSRWSSGSMLPGSFCLVCLPIGIGLTPLLNQFTEEFWFTWPLAIWSSLQLAIIAAERLRVDPKNRGRRRWSRVTGLLLIALLGLMFVALRQQSLPHEWVFLIGPLPAVVFAIPAGRAAVHSGWTLRTLVWMLLSLSVCFWAGPAWQSVRTAFLSAS
jgi:hypothetical protein